MMNLAHMKTMGLHARLSLILSMTLLSFSVSAATLLGGESLIVQRPSISTRRSCRFSRRIAPRVTTNHDQGGSEDRRLQPSC